MTTTTKRKREQGSALTEAAIIIPILILIVYWSSAITDVALLKLKSAEVARFALWELTVFRSQAAIQTDVQTRFADMKSPESVATQDTGLLLYPKPGDLKWTATINIKAEKVSFGGGTQPPNSGGLGAILSFVQKIIGFLSSAVDGAVASEKFNVYGAGSVSVSMNAKQDGSSIILKGGDLGPGKNQMDAYKLTTLDFSTASPGNMYKENPMLLVYDSWKAWPKPAAYTTDNAAGALADPSVSPMQTYPVVESMVSQQVNSIAFFGLNSFQGFAAVNNFLGTILSSGFGQAALGGDPPTIFATGPMDHAVTSVANYSMPVNHSGPIGPITILPVAAPDASFVPGTGLFSNRLGDLGSSNTSVTQNDDNNGMGAGADQSRYTLPYRINTKYWTAQGGAGGETYGSAVATPSATLTTNNNYVKAYACRGHYFAGSTKAQITDHTKRYTNGCPN